MKKKTLKQIVELLREEITIITNSKKGEIEIDKSLATNGINSLGFVDLLLVVEKHFQIKLMDNAMTSEDVSSINALAAKIEKIIKKQ